MPQFKRKTILKDQNLDENIYAQDALTAKKKKTLFIIVFGPLADDIDRSVLQMLHISPLFFAHSQLPSSVLFHRALHAQKEKGWKWILLTPFNGNQKTKDRKIVFFTSQKEKIHFFYSDVLIFHSYSDLQLPRIV